MSKCGSIAHVVWQCAADPSVESLLRSSPGLRLLAPTFSQAEIARQPDEALAGHHEAWLWSTYKILRMAEIYLIRYQTNEELLRSH